MTRTTLTFIVVAVIIGALILFFKLKSPDSNQYIGLLNPMITSHPDQTMLVVEVAGEPNTSAGKAIKLLFKTYFSLKGVPKSFKMPAPRARWPKKEYLPKEEWIGKFALPIPATITKLPKTENPDSLNIYISEWDYGTVAEVLHKGSYATEDSTVFALKEFIAKQGYYSIGDHEEEYIKGPGLFGPGNPDKYLTIIRYRITKKK